MILKRLALLHSILDIYPPETKVKQQSNFGKGLTHFCLLSTVALICLCFFPTNARAQITNVADDTIPPIPGAGHDYIHMLSETVNPANGTVSLKITMPTPKGRGISLPFSLTYNSGAALHFAAWAPDQAGFAEQVTPPTGGWGTSLPYLSFGQTQYSFPYGDGLPGSPAETCFFTTGYMFYDALGGHALNLAAMSPPPFINGSNGYCWLMNQASNGQIPAFTPENSGSDSQVEATFPQPCAQANYTVVATPTTCTSAQAEVDVFDGAGTIYYFGSSGVMPTNWIGSSDSFAFWPTKMEDRNGNIINFSVPNGGLAVTDTAGRTLVTMNNPNPGALVFAPTVITAGGLTYDLTYQTQPAPTFSLVGSQEELPTSVPTGITCGINFLPTATAPDVVHTISLPNSQTYTFSYDATYGLLSEIQYPDGGWVKYTWKLSDTFSEDAIFTGLYNNLAVQQGCNMLYKTPVVATRQVSFNGSSVALTQSFTYNTNWNTGSTDNYWTTKTTTVQTTDAVRGLTSQTIYTYSPVGQNPIPGFQGQGINASLIAVEKQVQYFNWGNTSTPIRQSLKQWFDQFNMKSQETLLDNSQASEVTYQYGFGGAVTQKNEYDYGSGAPGNLLRETVNNYQTFPANPRFPLNTPGFPATVSTLQTFPCQSIVYNGAGTRVAETDVEYDGGTSICGASGSASTVSASVPTGTHDETYYGPGLTTPRGNATTVTKQCFPSCTNAVTSYSYNETGQIVSKTDPCGNATCGDMTGPNSTNHTTSYSYLDNYSGCGGSAPPSGNTNAYLTKITDTFSHTQGFCYGYIDGQLRGATDPNSETTTYVYSDSLDRLTTTKYPDGGQTTFAYNDTHPTPSVTTTQAMGSAMSLTKIATRDGMGHTTTAQITSDPVGTDTTFTIFDGMGKPYQVYNPTRCSPATTSCGESTWGYSTFTVDALGRTTLVTNPDASTVQTSYTGRATEVSDEGNGTKSVQRISQADGLGRLVVVCEVSSTTLSVGTSGTPSACGQDISGTGFPTSYGYDPLGNLLSVSQGGLNPRSFAYDSLSRLTSSTNPESGQNSFAYDANGNLASKTAPKPNQTSASVTVATSFQYDSLNRRMTQSYNDGTTPTAQFWYDTCPVSGCPSGVTLTNAVGRLVESYTSNTGTFESYDPIGRVANEWQCTPQNCGSSYFPLIYGYDLIGDLTSSTNGFGVTISNSYNQVGELTTVASSLSDTTSHPGTLFSGGRYGPNGQLTGVTVWGGTPNPLNLNSHWMTELRVYNSRLRLTTLRDNAAYEPRNRIPIEYDLTVSYAPNGDVLSSTDTMNGSWTFTYDDFNRLASATDTTSSSAYTDIYDRYGNRWDQYLGGLCTAGTSFCVTFDANNHVNNGSLIYDAAGNVTADAKHHYAFDAENRLISVDAGTTASYIYDAQGNRVRKTTPVASLDYLYDLSNRPFVEVTVPASGAGTWDRSEVFADRRHLATYTGGATGATYNNFADGLGTERMRTTYAGVICETMTNLPFGDGQTTTGTCGDPSPLHFTGKEHDLESGLDNFGARYNSSSLGRFMSADPKPVFRKLLANPQDLNLYLYAVNNPLRYVDPDGKDWLDALKAAVNTLSFKVSVGFGLASKEVVGGTGAGVSVGYKAVLDINKHEPSLTAERGVQVEGELGGHKLSAGPVGDTKLLSYNTDTKTWKGIEKEQDSFNGAAAHTEGSSKGDFTLYGQEGTVPVPVADVPIPLTVGIDVSVDAKEVTEAFWKDNTPAPPPPPAPLPPQPATCAPNSSCP
jgi:RHS repeat-associated protein